MERLTDGWFGFYALHAARATQAPGRTAARLLDLRPARTDFTIALALAAYFFAARAAAQAFGSVILDLSNAAGADAGLVGRPPPRQRLRERPPPAFAAIAIHFGLGLGTLLEHWHASGRRRPASSPSASSALVVVQFLIPVYNLFGQLPRRSDIAAGRALIERIRQTPGDVWLTGQGYLAERAGKPSFAQAQAIRTWCGPATAANARGPRASTARSTSVDSRW